MATKRDPSRPIHPPDSIPGRSLIALVLLASLLGLGCQSDSPTNPQSSSPPGTPTDVVATATPGTVTVTWNSVEGATGYEVFWDTLGFVDSSDPSIEVDESPFVHSGLTNGTAYHYRVAAVNSAGSSNLSGQVSATPNQALGVRLIACGDFCSFLVDAQGYLYAWGKNNDGQLGVGSFNDVTTPALVPGVSDVVAVSSGQAHTLVLTGSGRLYAMGYNTDGALGVGDNQPRWYPTLVSGPTNFTAVAAGHHHSLAITADGEAYAWGNNTSGHLGVGQEGGNVFVPTLAMTSFWHTPGLATAGWSSNFFKPESDGAHESPIYSWGSNGGSRLGRDTGDDLDVGNTPSAIPSTVIVTAISSRLYHTLALRDEGSVLSWGVNSDGQLGRFTEGTDGLPDAVELVQNVQAVGAGYFHSLALGDDGRVMAWGGNGFGQLGDGTNNGTGVRTWVNNLTDVVMIAAGGDHNLALRSDGTLWAWGDNTYYQLGDGTVIGHHEPVRVTGF